MVAWLCGLPVTVEGDGAPPWPRARAKPIAALRLETRPPPDRLEGEPLLAGDGVSIHARQGLLEISAWDRDRPADRAWARLDPSTSTAELRSAPGPRSTWWLGEVLPELVVTHLWPLHGVVYLHASGTLRRGHTRLFLGSSGAGKSTAAALLHAAGDQPFCVDRVAVGDGWAAAAPFHGGEPSAGARAPLASLFLLDRHAPRGTQRLSPGEALACLAAHAFLPRWWPTGLAAGLDLLGRLAERLPIDRLSSEPDERLVERVGRACGQAPARATIGGEG